MADNQTTDVGITRYAGSLPGRAVKGFLRTVPKRLIKGRLMVEDIDTFEKRHEVGLIGRVGAIGVATRRSCRDDEVGVWIAVALWRHEVRPILNLTDLCQRYVEVVHHVATDMRLSCLLPEEETRGRQTVVERQAYDLERTVLIEQMGRIVIGNGVEHYLIGRPTAEEVEPRTQQTLERGMSPHMERSRAARQGQGREQADEAEAVVTMEMGEEYVTEAAELLVGAAELQLSPFAAIDHEEFLAEIDQLRRRHVPQRRQGTATTQNVNVELFHRRIKPLYE